MGPLFLTWALVGGERSTSCSSCFTPGKEPQCTLNRRLYGSQTWSGHFWRREKYLAHASIQTPDKPAHSLVVILITLSQLLWAQRFTKYEMWIGIHFLWQLLRGIEGNPKNITARPKCDRESNSVKPVNE